MFVEFSSPLDYLRLIMNKEKKINIAHLVYSFGTGGMENGIVNLVNNMNVNLFNHYIISFTFIGEFQRRITTKNVKIISINKKPGHSFLPYFSLRNIFIKNKIDIVHARGWATMMEGIISAKLARVPVTVYGFPGKTFMDMFGEKKRRILAQKILIKFTDGAVAYLNHMKNELCCSMNIPDEKVTILKNGVDLNKFTNVNSGYRSEFGIKDNIFVIGAVGRIDPVKNYGTLIEAFNIFSSKYDNVKLVLVGDGEDFNNVKNKALDMGLSSTVLMLGDREDVPNILKCFDVFVQPSLYEGMSNTILEAMASGLPVISSSVGGSPEIVKDEENGLLFNPLDVLSLVNRLERIYHEKELREKMVKANKKKINKEFSLEKMVKKYEKYYISILSSKINNSVT